MNSQFTFPNILSSAQTKDKILSLTLILTLLFIGPACAFSFVIAMVAAPAAYAHKSISEDATNHNYTPHGPIVESMSDGAEFINKMQKEVSKLNDYSLVFETKTFKKNETIVEKGKLYFKKPKLMRIEEIGEFNKGSVAVIGKDGKARAHAGGIASIITVTTEPDDKMLNAANGDKMEDSDFASLLRILQERLKEGQLARVTEKPVVIEAVGEPAYIIELYKAAEPKQVLKRIYVHPSSNLPIRWDDYDYKDPCLSTWKNVKSNIGLSDDLFKL